MRQVEFFVRSMGCACSGLSLSMREQEKITRAELLMQRLKDYPEEVETRVYHLLDDSEGTEGLTRLAGYLRRAGEEDFADRIAFSIKYVTPSIAVDGELKYMGDAPDVDDFLAELALQPE
jgi:hypothetical protein